MYLEKHRPGKWKLMVIFLALWLATGMAKGQNQSYDSSRVESLNREATNEIRTGNIPKAALHATQAFDLAVKISYPYGKANSLLTLGKLHRAKKDYVAALNDYLQAIAIFESLRHPALAQALHETALLYREWGAYEKAATYFAEYYKANAKETEKAQPVKVYALQNIALCYTQAGNYPQAIQYYQLLAEHYKSQQKKEEHQRVLEQLSTLSKQTGKYDQAIGYEQQILDLGVEDPLRNAQTLNNIGFLYKQLKEPAKALGYFNRALEINKKLLEANRISRNEAAQAAILTNIGTIHLYLGDYYLNSLNSFYEALKIRKKLGNPTEVAAMHNYLAANHYIGGNDDEALTEVQKAVALALQNNAPRILQESYRILSDIYSRSENFRESQKFYKMQLNLKDSLDQADAKAQQELLQNQIAIEKKENEFKTLLAEKEKQEIMFRQLSLEAEKKEQDLLLKANELAMLRQQQQLQETNFKNQQLEKERVQQALLLTQEQLNAQQRSKEILNLQKNKAMQELAIKEKELAQTRQQEEINRMSVTHQLQQQEIEEAEIQRKYGMGIMGLFGLIFFILVFSYTQKQKAARKLAAQKKAIEEAAEQLRITHSELQLKNDLLSISEEELRQNMEELEASYEHIEAQRAVMADTLQKLEQSNLQVTDSIRYAQRIQAAILPGTEELKRCFSEHFVIFRPKDVVSGDFYWFSQAGNKSFVAVVDCTGHGVPGAFMSMIGNTLLNEIVNEKRISEPGLILDHLNAGIYLALKQRETGNSDGMDICLCAIEHHSDENVSLSYSGAKRPVYYTSGRQVNQLNATRKSIGGWTKKHQEESFTTYYAQLQKGDVIYMTTDGFIDAANERRDRFGSQRLSALLNEICTLPLNHQQTRLATELDEHQQNALQRDDILLVGLKV